MRISDWSSDVCSSDLGGRAARLHLPGDRGRAALAMDEGEGGQDQDGEEEIDRGASRDDGRPLPQGLGREALGPFGGGHFQPARIGLARRVHVALEPHIAAQRQRPQAPARAAPRSEEHTSELVTNAQLVCRLLLEKKKNNKTDTARNTPK